MKFPNVAKMVWAAVATAFGSATHADYAPSRRSGPKSKGGAGAQRAALRLSYKMKANKAIPDMPIYTRQQRRAKERFQDKHLRSASKNEAMRQKLPGGAAAVV